MQEKDYHRVSLKFQENTDNNIDTLAGSVEEVLSDLFEEVLDKVVDKYEENSIVYLYELEQICKKYEHVLNEAVLTNIHDFFIQTSNISQERIDNQKRIHNTNTTIRHVLTNEAQKKFDIQTTLRNFINPNNTDNLEEIAETSRQTRIEEWLLRQKRNIQTSLDKYIRQPLLQMRTNLRLGRSDLTLGRMKETIFDYEVDEAVIQYMSENIFVATESTMSRVTQKVYDIIQESYGKEGIGIDELTRNIQDEFNNLKTFEAERIARTETLKAQSKANYERLKADNTVEYKQWIATLDERTRDTHDAQNEQITYIDGTFENGLEYPGDTSGDIEEWINCRCDVVAYYPEPGYAPPQNAEYWFEDDMEQSWGVYGDIDDVMNIPDIEFEISIEY